jgi:hypothetical protein
LVPPLFLLDSWDRQGLIKHVLLQVPVTDARGSHAPTTPECRLIRCRCQVPSSASSLRFLSPPSSTRGEQKPLLDTFLF